MIASADRGRACLTTNRLFGDVRPSGEIMQLLRSPERRNSGRALERWGQLATGPRVRMQRCFNRHAASGILAARFRRPPAYLRRCSSEPYLHAPSYEISPVLREESSRATQCQPPLPKHGLELGAKQVECRGDSAMMDCARSAGAARHTRSTATPHSNQSLGNEATKESDCSSGVNYWCHGQG
jgi:hypothetical protein